MFISRGGTTQSYALIAAVAGPAGVRHSLSRAVVCRLLAPDSVLSTLPVGVDQVTHSLEGRPLALTASRFNH
ncbi:hypothetical protein BDK61_3127 [Haloarcula quadrata]|jgi:hypothetical protein|uniref:Uncharacterized protein n=1 Tax=Haloarcula quadrata TaxID=182779 RepID=A0A495R8R1_9EURY|nr:hypothetical protein BDK61_3127 [Haloarcula quadrata]